MTSTPRRQRPNTPLRCAKCGGMKVRVFAITQELRRTFRRVGAQASHLHAACRCTNQDCRHAWWSAHETALTTAHHLQEHGVTSRIVWTERKTKDGTKRRRTGLAALLATAGSATASSED